MSKVIDFDQITRLKRELAERDEELTAAKAKLAQLNGVNEMLKLQIADLQDQLSGMMGQMSIILQNLSNLASKLPKLD